MTEVQVVKGWITYPDEYKAGWCHCHLILENGFAIYGHLCSDPGFAPGDLWFRRKERQEEWKNAGLELEIVGRVPYSRIPAEIMIANKNETYLDFVKKYFPNMIEDKAEVSNA